MKNYYDILGIPNNASKEEIKRAYYILAGQFHPDKNNGNDKRFKEINEAYRILSLESSRSQYDKEFDLNKTHKNTKHKVEKDPNHFTSSDISSKGWSWVTTIATIALIRVIFFSSDGNFDKVVQQENSTSTYVAQNIDDIKSIVGGAVNKKENKIQNTVSDVPIQKNGLDYCIDKQGVNSTYDAKSNSCGCASGYIFDNVTSQCVTQLQYCQNLQGYNATYTLATNSCGCADGYYYGAVSKQCISLVAYRDESCSLQYSNSSFLKYSNDNKTYICACNSDYYWNNNQTACLSKSDLNQQCTSFYGSGSYSTTDSSGKNVCDCSYGYNWNIQRDRCVTTASINQICVTDIGRNSYYLGNVTNGKYNCSNPY